MNEKNLFKEAASAKMPNIEDVRKKCISQEVQFSKSNPQKSFCFKKIVPLTACAAIALIAILAIPKSNNNSVVAPPISSGSPNISQPYPNAVNATININELTENPMSANRRYFDPEKTYTKKITFNEITEYLGKDIRPTLIPATVKASGDFTSSIIYNNDGTVAFDQFAFIYDEHLQDGEYNPLEKQLRIFVSKTGKASDCLYVWSEDMIESQINGQKLMIGKRKMGYGPYTVAENGPNIPTGYYDLFVAEFEIEGISYQVVSDNFEQDEFIDTIDSMIKK